MKKQDGLPRNPRTRFHFRTKAFDFMFQWIMGSSSEGGAEVGEAMYVASRIPEGDGEAWYREFTAMGDRVVARGQRSLDGGHLVSASTAFLRGYTYYRGAPLFLSPRQDPRYREAYEKGRNCFHQGTALFERPLGIHGVPYKDRALPLYTAQPAQPSGKTLLMIGGGDTFVEDLYFYIVPQALRRGYQVAFADLPGQGALPWEGLPFEAASERPMAAVIDALEALPDFDTSRLALYGISGGGYLTPRAASYERRINALVACSVILDLTTLWTQNLLNFHRSFLGRCLQATRPALYASVTNLVDTYRWRWGVETNEELMEVSKAFVVNPREIRCPTLNIVAQQEYEFFEPTRNAAQRCTEDINHPESRLVVTPEDEGADSHAVGTNTSLMAQLVFDWLDEVLDKV